MYGEPDNVLSISNGAQFTSRARYRFGCLSRTAQYVALAVFTIPEVFRYYGDDRQFWPCFSQAERLGRIVGADVYGKAAIVRRD